jgi:hypothetical protein
MILIPLLMGLVRWFTNRQHRPEDARREDYVVVQPGRPIRGRRTRRRRYY